jgi:hypothetical protein
MMKVPEVNPWVLTGVVAVVGVAFLCWHQYVNDDDDVDWTTPKETQPPTQVGFDCSRPPVGPAHGGGARIGLSVAFRGRRFPASLAADVNSVIGEF